MCVFVCLRIRTCASSPMCVCVCAHVCVCLYARVCLCVYTCTAFGGCIRAHVCTCVCVSGSTHLYWNMSAPQRRRHIEIWRKGRDFGDTCWGVLWGFGLGFKFRAGY